MIALGKGKLGFIVVNQICMGDIILNAFTLGYILVGNGKYDFKLMLSAASVGSLFLKPD